MTTRTDYHTETAGVFLAKARVYLAEGDLLQASEKGWGAASQIVKAVAESRGWDHRGHRDLFNAVNRLAEEFGNNEIKTLFYAANALHQNFYEGWMPEESVAQGLTNVEQFVRRLGEAID